MISIEALEAMVAAGVSAADIVAVIRADRVREDCAISERRRKDKERKRRSRGQSVTSRDIADKTQAVVERAGEVLPDNVAAIDPSHTTASETTISFFPTPLEDLGPRGSMVTRARSTPRAKRQQGHHLPDDWVPKLHHYREGLELGFQRENVDSQAEDLRLWARSNEHRAVARKSNWDSTFSGWMRRNSQKDDANGSSRKGSLKSSSGSYSTLAAGLRRTVGET